VILREQWQDPELPVTGPARKQSTAATVLHYEGGGRTTPVDSGADWCRSGQASYLSSRGYSLGYNFAVMSYGPDDGVVFEIRGAGINNAANNGDDRLGWPYNVNDYTRSIIVVGEQDREMSAAALDAVRAFKVGEVVGHRDVDATACPGERYYSQIVLLNQSAPDPEEPDMLSTFVWTHNDDDKPGAFLVAPGGVVHLDADMRDIYITQGTVRIHSDNDDVYESYRRVAMGL